MADIRLLYLVHEKDGVLVRLVSGYWKEGAHLPRDIYPVALDKLVKGQAVDCQLDATDRRLMLRLQMAQSFVSREVMLNGTDGFLLLQGMMATGRCYHLTHNRQALSLSDVPFGGTPIWRKNEDGLFAASWKTSRKHNNILTVAPPLLVDPANGSCSPLQTSCESVAAAAWARSGNLTLGAVPEFLAGMKARFPNADWPLPEELKQQSECESGVTPRFLVQYTGMNTLFFMPETTEVTLSDAELVGRLFFNYSGQEIPWHSAAEMLTARVEGQERYLARDKAREKECVDVLDAHGVVPASETQRNRWEIHGSWQEFIEDTADKLRALGWHIECPEQMNFYAPQQADWYSSLQKTQSGWYDFELGILVNGKQVNVLPVVVKILRRMSGFEETDLALLRKQVFPVLVPPDITVELSGVRVAEIVTQLIELHGKVPLNKSGHVKLSGWRAAELTEFEDWSEKKWQIDAAARKMAEALQKRQTISKRSPAKGFRAELRSYQGQGLGWLEFLAKYELGGILADDMGLGKTVQALALLHKLYSRRKKPERPSIIVAPRSVLYNWMDEASRFAPDLPIKMFYAADRESVWEELSPGDILLTTYGILRNELDRLCTLEFEYIILDEAQSFKNMRSKTARGVFSLKGVQRLCLTGTPLENHLGELWSLFNFVLPGFLGGPDEFNTGIRSAIEQDDCGVARRFLRNRIAPFVLRRTKDVVATELPAKTTMIQRVDLTDMQRETYHTVRLAAEKKVRSVIADKGLARSHMDVLTALLRLRQVCCDPRIVPGSPATCGEDSAKLQWLTENLPEMIEEGRRILLFSQFVMVLEHIESCVKDLGISYVKLTGASTDREKSIKTFQQEDVPLFLISLKAGGTGINLTAADTVIHFDPWWNPAVENQATDRAHRIGQDKPVFVYKLIAAGSIEERVLRLQETKAGLLEDILTERDGGTLKIDEEMVNHLLAPLTGVNE